MKQLQQQRNRTTALIVGLVILIAGIAGGAMLALSPSPSVPRSPARVEYRVIGDAVGAKVVFLNDNADLEERDATLPASYRFRALPGRELSIQVTRTGDTGSIGCLIKVDNQDLVVVAAEAGRQEATCQAVVPEP